MAHQPDAPLPLPNSVPLSGRGRGFQTDGGVRPEMGREFGQQVAVPLENFEVFQAHAMHFLRKTDVPHTVGSVSTSTEKEKTCM